MDYPCYPITKAKDAFVLIGEKKVKLPRTEWKVQSGGKSIKCSYHLQVNKDLNGTQRYVILLQAETHWTNAITIHMGVDQFTTPKKDLKKDPPKAISLAWSSGGTIGGYTPTQIADTLASLWKIAGRITSKFEREIYLWAISEGKW
jgi:hypothetical protein